MDRRISRALLFLVALTAICALAYNQTRQVNVLSVSKEVAWVQFVNGQGEPVSRRGADQVRTYWNEKGRKYVRVHLQDGREFDVHYFHSDSGRRRRVVIEIDVKSEADGVVVRLLYEGQEVARSREQLQTVAGKTIDLMAAMMSQQSSGSDAQRAEPQ